MKNSMKNARLTAHDPVRGEVVRQCSKIRKRRILCDIVNHESWVMFGAPAAPPSRSPQSWRWPLNGFCRNADRPCASVPGLPLHTCGPQGKEIADGGWAAAAGAATVEAEAEDRDLRAALNAIRYLTGGTGVRCSGKRAASPAGSTACNPL
jgi:hypothetical protein